MKTFSSMLVSALLGFAIGVAVGYFFAVKIDELFRTYLQWSPWQFWLGPPPPAPPAAPA